MLTNINIISKRCAKNNNIDEALMASIGNAVVDATYRQVLSLESLSTTVMGFYKFFYGKKRLLEVKDMIEYKLGMTDQPPIKNKVGLGITCDKTPEQLQEMYKKVNKLLDDYEVFIKEKNKVKNENLKMVAQQEEL